MDKPCNAADAPLLANPSGPGRFPLMRRCRLLIGSLPNLVGSALPEGKSAAVAATRNTQTGSSRLSFLPEPVAQQQRQPANVEQGFSYVLLDPPPEVPYPENCDHVDQAVQADPSLPEAPLGLCGRRGGQRNQQT